MFSMNAECVSSTGPFYASDMQISQAVDVSESNRIHALDEGGLFFHAVPAYSLRIPAEVHQMVVLESVCGVVVTAVFGIGIVLAIDRNTALIIGIPADFFECPSGFDQILFFVLIRGEVINPQYFYAARRALILGICLSI